MSYHETIKNLAGDPEQLELTRYHVVQGAT